MRDLQVHPIYGVEPVSQTFVFPLPGNGVRVRSSSCRPDFLGANSIGSGQLWPAAMPARQVFCPVVRMRNSASYSGVITAETPVVSKK